MSAETPSQASLRGRAIEVLVFDAVGLGDRSYLVHDGSVAIVVDPQRDPRPYLESARGLGVRISHVLETHVHNDYVSGGTALAAACLARYGVPAGAGVASSSKRDLLHDGSELCSGAVRVRVIATPGHTQHHLAYLFQPAEAGEQAPGMVCTGGSLLASSTGRTDLLGEDLATSLAGDQWRSVRRLLNELAPETAVLPTHGFGSFCSSTPSRTPVGGLPTIGSERVHNPVAFEPLESFVRRITVDPLPIPGHYRHMAPLNRAGQPAPDLRLPPPSKPAALVEAIRSRGRVLDLRGRRRFAGAHHVGTLNVELSEHLSLYAGWLIPFDDSLALVASERSEVEEAVTLLSRIGRESIAAWTVEEDWPEAAGPPGHYPVATFADLASAQAEGERLAVVDVRHRHEWREAHLLGARNVPLPELASVVSSIPADVRVWVHCAAGYRAAIGASILVEAGRDPVLVDDLFANATAAGLALREDRATAPLDAIDVP